MMPYHRKVQLSHRKDSMTNVLQFVWNLYLVCLRHGLDSAQMDFEPFQRPDQLVINCPTDLDWGLLLHETGLVKKLREMLLIYPSEPQQIELVLCSFVWYPAVDLELCSLYCERIVFWSFVGMNVCRRCEGLY